MQLCDAGNLNLRNPSDTGKYSRQDQKKPKVPTVLYPNGVPSGRAAGDFPGLVEKLEKDANAAGLNSRALMENLTESGLDEEMFSDEYLESESEFEPREKQNDAAGMRIKRSVPEFMESARSGEARSEEQRKSPGLRMDGPAKRTEVRLNRDDDGKVSDSRPDEPRVVSSTFALAGDSAHNHAVVYWSGKNSSELYLENNSPLF
ncbi:VPS10 domain-containing receptor [Triplophysa tibetana]|uniref:VPS10 domain-containing receptor n=1 Tax=Triplophysa tibetana TaxID=1572043 RepID=A0A5A9PLS1_9TELE|nr:VPS10 domain-containing receptor [Triplophysa tibetana]